MKAFVQFCLDRPITTLTLHILLLLGGIMSVQRIPLSATPEFGRTSINVVVPYPNASPIQVENEVVLPLEEALATLRGLRGINSESRENNARVTLRFDYGEDLDAVKVEVRERIARAMDQLPVEDIERVQIRTGGWGADGDAIMEARISAVGVDLSENYELLVNRIQRPLERLDGVGQVELDGVTPQEVKITFTKGDLERHGLTLGRVSQAIRNANIDITIGRIWSDGKVRRLRLINALPDVEALHQLPINANGLRLGQVATIEKEEGDLRWGRHLNGSYAVSLEISQESGANTVEVCRMVRAEVERISHDPQLAGINLLVWQDQGQMIVSSLERLRDAGFIGGGMALVILFLFLRRFSATLLVGMAIPISVLSALAVLHLLDKELNIITIMALMLGVGMLVDTAVVVVESIVRRAGLGDDPVTAATKGTMEVATPVFAATLTTMVVFLPVFISERNGFSDALSSVGLVISLTIAASLFVSLTLVPMVAARIYSGGDPGLSSWFLALRGGYERLLVSAMKHRVVTILLAIAATFSVMIPFDNGFRMDLSDADWKSNYANISYRPEEGLDFREMEKVVTEIETLLDSKRDIIGESDIYSWYTDGYAMTRIYPPAELATEDYITALRGRLNSVLPKVPGIRIRTDDGWGWGGGHGGGGNSTAGSFNVRLRGDSSALLQDLGDKVAQYLKGVEGVIDAEISRREEVDELHLKPDEDLLGRLQVSGATVARSISAAFSGNRLSQLRTRSGDLDITLGLDEEETDSVEELKFMRFPLRDDLELPIEEIGSLAKVEAPSRPRRDNRRSSISVSAQYDVAVKDEIQQRLEQALASYPMPVGYSWDLGEGWSGRWRNQGSFSEGLYLSIFLVYLVLACLFESLRTPLILMITVLLAVPGVIWSLWLQGDALDTPAAVGLILLCGIVVNNGIVLIDQVRRRIDEGETPANAIRLGASDRFRPILITALTTILGLVPMAYGTEMLTGPQFNTLGKAIVGGLAASTLMTLVVLPAVLTLVLKSPEKDSGPGIDEKPAQV